MHMNNLYSGLAEVYEAMYRTFIDYEAEFAFYIQLLGNQVGGNSLLEIGCGTGHLASRFSQAGFLYTGLDLSSTMLEIARRKHPTGTFVEADMRHFDQAQPTDAVVMTGRTISYLLTNQDLSDCFASVRRNLRAGGLFCFDFIDASRFIPMINGGRKITHHAEYNDKRFFRESFWQPNLHSGWAFDWQSVFYEDQPGLPVRIGEDHSTIRAFTRDEIELFLKIAGFGLLHCIDRPTYAFDTFAVVAQ